MYVLCSYGTFEILYFFYYALSVEKHHEIKSDTELLGFNQKKNGEIIYINVIL